MIKAFLILLMLTASVAMAVPTGTVTRSVGVYTNTGLLVDTNFMRVNGIADTGSVSLAMATGVQAQASADLAMQEAQRGATNVTGLLTWTDRIMGLTAAAVSNAMAGIYALVDHLHGYTAITNAPWAAEASYVVTSNTAAGAWNESVYRYWLSASTDMTTIANSPAAVSIGKTGYLANSIDTSPGAVQVITDPYISPGYGVVSMSYSDGGVQKGVQLNGKCFVDMVNSPAGVQIWSGNAAASYPAESHPFWMDASPGAIQIGPMPGNRLWMEYATAARQYVGWQLCTLSNSYGAASLQMIGAESDAGSGGIMTGAASIGLGACRVWHNNAIVAGSGQESHGDGTITAGGGFYGPGTGLTNLTPAQIGAVWRTNQVLGIDGSTNTIIYLGAP